MNRLILTIFSIILVIGGGCMPQAPQNNGPVPLQIRAIRTSSGYMRPIMVAHRCGAGLGPENTRGAVVQSSFYRPDYFEIDIRHTRDDVAVCIHDETVDRTTNMTGKVTELLYPDLKEANAGSWFGPEFNFERVLTFAEMLDGVNPSPLAIEFKEADITSDQCRKIAETLESARDISSIILSFYRSALETYGTVDPERYTCYLTLTVSDYALNGEHEIVGLLYSACTKEAIDQIHAADKSVFVWTVDNDFTKYIDMGVDGIVTNHPERMREELPPS